MKVLVLILTSNKLDLLKQCIKSVENQQDIPFEYTLKIVVNTLNEKYYENVLQDKYVTKYEIIRTESNGFPGKGHNSLLQIFKESTEYDYLIPVDGDDMLYPSAFTQYKKFLEYNPDILHILLNDYAVPTLLKNKKIPLKNNFFLYSCFNEHKNYIMEKHELNNPFKSPINKCKTPSRIILLSRNIFNMDCKLSYGEDLTLYDDYPPFLQILKDTKINKILTSESNIYFYNKLNDMSVSHNFKDITKENKVFDKYRSMYNIPDFDNAIKELNFKTVSYPKKFNLQNKIDFINEYYVDPYVITFKKQSLTNIKIAKIYTKHLKIYNEEIIKFIIENENNLNEKFIYVDLLLEYFPNIHNFNFALQLSKSHGIYTKIKTYESMIEYHTNNNIIQEKRVESLNIRKKLVYYVGESQEFNGEDYQNKNIWGSEIAAVKLCEQLSKTYDTYIVCNTSKEIKYNNVTYIDLKNFNYFLSTNTIDNLIISRFTHSLILFNLSQVKNIYFLFHDTRCHDKCFNKTLPKYAIPLFLNNLNNFKKLIFVSEWQKNNFIKILEVFNYKKCIEKVKDKSIVISNGITLELFEDIDFNKKQKHRYIYHSDPSRGLLKLCEIIIELQKIYPETQLDIYYSHIDDKNIINVIENYSFIKFHGKLENNKIINELKKTNIWIYPNINSHETFCIAALEAMSSGNLVITLDYSGSGELVKNSGIVLDKNTKVSEYVNYIKNLYDTDDLLFNYMNNCMKESKKYSWKTISEKWCNMLN